MQRIRSTTAIGQLIRSRREARGLSQADLAKKLGASRKWVIEAEGGKTTAEIGRILRALNALDIQLFVPDENEPQTVASADDIPDVLDVLAAYHRK